MRQHHQQRQQQQCHQHSSRRIRLRTRPELRTHEVLCPPHNASSYGSEERRFAAQLGGNVGALVVRESGGTHGPQHGAGGLSEQDEDLHHEQQRTGGHRGGAPGG